MIPMPVELPGWVIGAVTFATTIFAFIAIAAFAQTLHLMRHQRQLKKELQRMRSRSRGGLMDVANPLLRARREKSGAVQFMLARFPRMADASHLLEQADSRMTVGAFLLFSLGSASAFSLTTTTLGLSPVWIGLSAGMGLLVPVWILMRRRKKRFMAFEENFPNAIDLLGRAIRAGHALSTGLDMVAEEAAEPVASEFRQVFEEQKYGLPLEESLQGLNDRIALPDVRIFSTAVTIQRDVGGNLAEILDNLSAVVRERFSFRRQLRTYTAQGRMTGVILGLAPIVAGIGMFFANPEYMRPLIEERSGHMMLMGAVGLQMMGFILIRRITDIEY